MMKLKEFTSAIRGHFNLIFNKFQLLHFAYNFPSSRKLAMVLKYQRLSYFKLKDNHLYNHFITDTNRQYKLVKLVELEILTRYSTEHWDNNL